MLMAKTVTIIDSVTKIMVNTRYSPIRGITLEDEGMISSITSRKTVSETSTEVHRLIFSPSFEGRWKTTTVRNESPIQGIIRNKV
jgi:hypothetical protein